MKKKMELCAPHDTNGGRAYTEHDPFGDAGETMRYGVRVSVDGRGAWRVIDIHPESGDIGLDAGDGIWYVRRSRVCIVKA